MLKPKCINNGLSIFTEPGNPIADEFVLDYDEEGVEILKESGKIDLQAFYNQFKDSCDLSIIVSNLIAQGINPFNANLTYLDEVEDISMFKDNSLAERLEALRNYEKNKSLINQYIQEQAAQQQSISQTGGTE